jgi:excinuclease UvrABC nuclease subunit
VLVVRGKDLPDDADQSEYQYIFGPFPSGVLFKSAMQIVRKLFQFYDTKSPVTQEHSKLTRGKIDFNRQIGLYPQACTPEEYARTIKHIVLLFQGKKNLLIKDLEREMHAYAKEEKFEEAQKLKLRICALKHIQDVALIRDDSKEYRDERTFRLESYDIAHLQGDAMVGVMVVFRGNEPQKSEYRTFKIRGFDRAHDIGALYEMLSRRFSHSEWKNPDFIVVDGSTAQCNVVRKLLKEKLLHIPVVGVVKDEHHKPVRLIGSKSLTTLHRQTILFANAEAHRFAITYHRNLLRKNKLSAAHIT